MSSKQPVVLRVVILSLYVSRTVTLNGCKQLLEPFNLTEDTGRVFGHGLHSMTVNDLRFYFDEKASEKNGIPTVNFNLSGPALLENAQYIQLAHNYFTPAYAALDHILSNIDDPKYGVKNANALDMIAHALHMQELWSVAGKAYKGLKRRSVTRKMCKCLEDTYGEMTALVMKEVAKQIRTPELVYTSPEGVNTTDPSYSVYEYSFSVKVKKNRKNGKLVGTPSIVDELTWAGRRDGMFMPAEAVIEEGRQLAMYIFCKMKYD